MVTYIFSVLGQRNLGLPLRGKSSEVRLSVQATYYNNFWMEIRNNFQKLKKKHIEIVL